MLVAQADASARSRDLIETLKTPTPTDLDGGNDDARHLLFLGLGAMFVCDMAAVATFVRSRKPAPQPTSRPEAR